MSKMSELYTEILEMMEYGVSDHVISKTLGIPNNWVDNIRIGCVENNEGDCNESVSCQ
jgi:hypothetical protein